MRHKRAHFPREDYQALGLYTTERDPVDVDLSDNTNQWGAHPGALQAVRDAVATDLTRYPDFYSDELRQAAAERWGVGPGNICTGAGSDHILDSAFRACSVQGGMISYAAPTFVMVEHFARANGHTTRKLTWAQAMADPQRLLHGDPSLVYVCRPNNPTGFLAPREWMDQLLDAAGANGPLVLVDEAYGDFAPPHESMTKEAAARPRLLVVRTLSKAYGLAGLRVGVGVGSPEVAKEIEKSRGPYMVTTLGEAAAVKVLRDEEGWVARTVAECLDCRGRLIQELDARGLTPLPTAANFVMIPVGEGCALRYAQGLRRMGVRVRPFPAMPDLGDGIRVTVGPWPLMERFLEALDQVIAADEPASHVQVEVEQPRKATAL
jgi:histidinol-phosphate aminotransferase